MILFPSRGRPQQLMKVVETYQITGVTSKVLLILDEDDAHRYDDVKGQLPDNFSVLINKNVLDFKAAVEAGYAAYPDEPWYGGGSDDLFPLTYGWDVKLAEAAVPHNLSWGDDGCHGENLASAPFFGASLIKSFGWIMPPFLKRGYADFLWMGYARELGICRYLSDVKFDHRHWQVLDKQTGKRKANFDETYASQPSVADDKLACEKHLASEEFKTNVERIRKELEL